MSNLFPHSSYGSGGTTSQLGGRAYPDPFSTYTSFLMPRTIEHALRWSEAIWVRQGTVTRALKRVVAYFLTRVEVSETSEEELDRYDEFLNSTLNVISIMSQLGDDLMCYGNSFSSVITPFARFLRGDGSNIETPIDKVDFTFNAGKFSWICPSTGKRCQTSKPVDRKITDESKIKIKLWSPHEIKIRYNPVSEERIYIWDPPGDVVRQIKSGDPFILKTTPWEIIEAVVKGKLFEFGPGVIFHMREEVPSGVQAGGWGLSQLIFNFSQAYYIQKAKMFNEVLMNEYLIPFRLISPAKGTSPASDPLIQTSLGDFNSQVLRMLDRHRANPGGWNALPFPVEYQALGGEGMQFTTYEHIDMATDELLNAAGVPAELYKGTLQFQALPTALRLFQQTWPHLKSAFDSWLEWLVRNLSEICNWDRAKAKLQQVTLADDIEKRSIVMELMAGQRVSAKTALSPLGIDADEELKKIIAEREDLQRLEEEFAEDQQRKQMYKEHFQGAPPVMQGGGGMPGGSTTPQDVDMQADQKAQELLAMPYEMRRSEMYKIKKSDPTFHAIIKQKMEDLRSESKSVGGHQALQQMVGGPMGQAPMV